MKLEEAKEILMVITPGILMVVCFGFLVGCNRMDAYPPIPKEAQPKEIYTSGGLPEKYLSIVHVEDKGVTCFLFESTSHYHGISASCITDSQISYGNPATEGDK